MSEHRLTACRSRAVFQLERVTQYLSKVTPVLPDDDEDPLRQFLYQSCVMMVQSYFEEYLRCIVSTATFWKTPDVRRHLGESLQKADWFAVMPAPEVEQHAQQRVSFDDGAKRLKALFQVLTNGSPFADEEAESKCLDFVAVRNIIAHRGGWATEANVPTVKSPNVIVSTRTIGRSTFYTLRLGREFFGECLVAMGRSIAAVERRAESDPVFRL